MLGRIDRAVSAFLGGVLSAAILALSLLSIANVIARNAFGESLAFAEEISQALVVALTFSGVAVGARRGRHIRMSAFFDALSGRAQRLCWTACAAGTALLLAALAAFAAEYVHQVAASGRVTPALRLPLFAIYATAPLGLALGAIEYALLAYLNFCASEIHLSRQPDAAESSA